jgi:peptidoglycan/xylan/chitin deacetylase (PgdA/CDA1 family)
MKYVKRRLLRSGLPRENLSFLVRRNPATGLLMPDSIGISARSKADNSTTATYFVLPNTDASNHVRYSAISLADCALAGAPAASINALFTAGGAGTKIVLGSGTYGAAEMSAGTSGVRMAAADQSLIGVRGGTVILGATNLNDNTVYGSAAGHLIQNIRPIRGTGGTAAIYSRPGAGGVGIVDGCYFATPCPGYYLYQENGTIKVLRNTFVGSEGSYDVRFAGSVLFAFNTVKNSASSAATQLYLQAAGSTCRFFSNLFSGHAGPLLVSAGTHTSGVVDFCGNMVLPPDSATGPQGLSLNAAITGSVDGNYIAANPRFVQAPTFGAAQTIGTNHYSDFPGITATKTSGYLTFSIDDYNDSSYHTWDYMYGTDGTDGLVALMQSYGAKLVWFINTKSLAEMPDYATKIAWFLAQDNIEWGCHTVTHSDMAFTGKIWDVVKGAETVTVDRAADTITLSGGGAVTGFRAKTLEAIRTELTALGCTITPVANYDSGVAGTLSQYVKGEAIDNVAAGTSLTLLRGDDTEGYIKAEIYDSLDALEALVGVGTVKSFAYPFGSGRTDAYLKGTLLAGRSGQITSARSVNIDGSSPCKINGLDRYTLAATTGANLKTNVSPGDTDADIKAGIHGLCAYLAENGGYSHLYCHSASDLSLPQWNLVLAEAYKWSAHLHIGMSAADVMDDLLSIATDTNGILAYQWTDNSNYRLLSTSFLKNIGAAPFIATDGDQYDLNGNMVYHAAMNRLVYHAIPGLSIGAYQYGGPDKVYHGLTVANAWAAIPELYDVIGLNNAVYAADGSSVAFDTPALALAALASLADDQYLWGGTKAAALFNIDMTAKAGPIKRYVGDTA